MLESLFRLREINENRSKKQNIDKNSVWNGASTINKKYSREQNALKESFKMNLNSDMGINRPYGDSSCMANYPISCISNNWETIKCHVFLPTSRHRMNASYQHNYLSSTNSLPRESQACTNFKVHLEHIK